MHNITSNTSVGSAECFHLLLWKVLINGINGAFKRLARPHYCPLSSSAWLEQQREFPSHILRATGQAPLTTKLPKGILSMTTDYAIMLLPDLTLKACLQKCSSHRANRMKISFVTPQCRYSLPLLIGGRGRIELGMTMPLLSTLLVPPFQLLLTNKFTWFRRVVHSEIALTEPPPPRGKKAVAVVKWNSSSMKRKERALKP